MAAKLVEPAAIAATKAAGGQRAKSVPARAKAVSEHAKLVPARAKASAKAADPPRVGPAALLAAEHPAIFAELARRLRAGIVAGLAAALERGRWGDAATVAADAARLEAALFAAFAGDPAAGLGSYPVAARRAVDRAGVFVGADAAECLGDRVLAGSVGVGELAAPVLAVAPTGPRGIQRGLLRAALARGGRADAAAVAAALEAAIFARTGVSGRAGAAHYFARCAFVAEACETPGSAALAWLAAAGDASAQAAAVAAIAAAPAVELDPRPFEKIREILRARAEQVVPERTSSQYRCPVKRCGSNKILVQVAQTRSADEAPTVICTCSECGRRFRG